MSNESFTNLVNQVVDAARRGEILGQDLYLSALESAPSSWCRLEPKTVSHCIRQLGEFCDWDAYRWATECLAGGVRQEDLPDEINRIEEQKEVIFRSVVNEEAIDKLAKGYGQLVENNRKFLTAMRDVETLMGFDSEATKGLVRTLGAWDWNAIPGSLIDLLPQELTFPLRQTQRSMPYDHSIHLLVKELISRMGEEAWSADEVIENCGHILCQLLHHNDRESSARLMLRQVTLLAEAYVRSKQSDIIGLCWRGELACWDHDDNLAREYARNIWLRTASLTSISRVAWFFALTADPSPVWSEWTWDCLDRPLNHLGELKSVWIDREQPLAMAIVNRAFRQGTWDTSLLQATFTLRDEGYFPEPHDAPTECWVWMAEHLTFSQLDNELYYDYWCDAFDATHIKLDQNLEHNIIVVLLAGLLFNKIPHRKAPSIQRLLAALSDLHRCDSDPHKLRAALGIVKYVYQKMNPDYLTAADRLAITKAIEDASRPPTGVSLVESSPKGSTSEQIDPSLLNQAEVYLKTQISETTWARLTPKAKNEFKLGEFLYIMATKPEGEGGNFDSFVLHYSKGLLAEIQESLRAPLLKDQSLKGQFLAVFGGQERPEWAQLLRFISDLENVAGTALGKRLLSQGVVFPRLRELRDFFEKMKALRNRAAHSGSRINRDEATLLHGLLLNKGGIQSAVECFPKPPKR